MLLSTHTFAVCTRHTHPGPVITFPTPPLSTQTQRHINRLPRTYAGRHMQKCEYINADTYRNKRKRAGIYTRTNPQAERTEHTQTKSQCDTKTKIHSGRTYTPVQLRQPHISQSHFPHCAVFTAEKTDWACLFVGSPLHVCLLCFSQWKTSILRIIKWLKRALLIGCARLPSV